MFKFDFWFIIKTLRISIKFGGSVLLKSKLIKTILALTLMVSLAIPLSVKAAGSNNIIAKYPFEANEIYVMDAKTGQEIYQKNAYAKRPIASLSKLMTLYLTKEAIDSGKMSWNQKVPVDKHLISLSKNSVFGSFQLKKTKQYTVKQMYQAALIASSNSAAIALGEMVAHGSNNNFVKMMNNQAKSWKLNASFVSASGLDNTDLKKYNCIVPGTGKDAQNLVSAHDISYIAARLLEVFPSITQWSSKSTQTIGKQTLVNVNSLLPGRTYAPKQIKVDGLKNGYTENAGLCLTATYWSHGRNLIATIIDSSTIFSSMAKLMQTLNSDYTYSKAKLDSQKFVEKKYHILAVPKEKTTVIWHKAGTSGTPKIQYIQTVKNGEIKKGEVVGQALISLTGTKSFSVPLISKTTTPGAVKKKVDKKTVPKKSMVSSIGGAVESVGTFIVAFVRGIFAEAQNIVAKL